MATIADVVVQEWVESRTEQQRVQMESDIKQVVDFFRSVGEAVRTVVGAVVSWVEQTNVNHERAELLRIYKLRHKWKTADVARLGTYRLNKAARRRVATLATARRLGRGATVAYTPWYVQLAAAAKYCTQLFDPDTGANERVRLLRKHASWYPQFVERTYRGEYQLRKQLGGAAPAEEAERAVAEVLCTSRSSVRRFCIQVRKNSAFCLSLSEAITVAEFEVWKKSGKLSKS